VFGTAVAFTLLCYVFLLATSGNRRYGIPLELCIAPMIMASLLALRASTRMTLYATAAVPAVQAVLTQIALAPRWNSTEWKTQRFDVSVPEVLRAKPYLFLSLNKQTNAPRAVHESGFVVREPRGAGIAGAGPSRRHAASRTSGSP
jgi:hypothetical protein